MTRIYKLFIYNPVIETAEFTVLTKKEEGIILFWHIKMALMGSSKRQVDAKRGSGWCKLP